MPGLVTSRDLSLKTLREKKNKQQNKQKPKISKLKST